MDELLRKLRFSRIVSIQGPRQCGKSFLARELLGAAVPHYQYVTLDKKELRVFAQQNPSSFLSQYKETPTLVVDEAQKAPDLFDEIKATVDIDTRPGQFLLLGSTEFSRETLVRESLTGRISRLRLFPLNAAEAFELPINQAAPTHFFNQKPRINRTQLFKMLNQGGFPAIFAVRSNDERDNKLQEWIEVTAFRDLTQFKGVKIDPELAMEIFEALAHLELPLLSEIRRHVKRDLRVVKKHLDLLRSLFAIVKVPSHPAGTGKDMYYLCDPGVVTRLGGTFERALETWTLLEIQSQAAYQNRLGIQFKIQFYLSAKKSLTHFVVDTPKKKLLLHIHPGETWQDKDLRGLLACKEKLKDTSVQSVFLYGGQSAVKHDSIELFPWESLV